jgi:hypothetical protein
MRSDSEAEAVTGEVLVVTGSNEGFENDLPSVGRARTDAAESFLSGDSNIGVRGHKRTQPTM